MWIERGGNLRLEELPPWDTDRVMDNENPLIYELGVI